MGNVQQSAQVKQGAELLSAGPEKARIGGLSNEVFDLAGRIG